MGASVRPDTIDFTAEQARIRRNVEKMVAGGASQADIDRYLTEYEGLQPKAEAKAPAPAPVSPGKQFVSQIVQGVGLGFGDEAIGGINALDVTQGGTMRSRYEAGRDRVRAADKAAQREHPIGSLATQAASGSLVALPLAATRVAQAPKLLTTGQQVIRGAKAGAAAGAAYGAVAGAGNAEGGFENRARGAAAGGLFGGVTGATLGGLTPAALAAWRSLRVAAADRAASMSASARAEVKEQILSGITDQAERARIESMIEADPVLSQSWGRARTGAVGNLGPMGSGSPLKRVQQAYHAKVDPMNEAAVEDAANEDLLRLLERDKKTPATIREALNEHRAKAPGTEPTLNLMDLSGRNMQGRGRAVMAAKGEGKEIIPAKLEARGKQAEDEIIGTLLNTSGQKRISRAQTKQQMVAERSANAEKLYAPIRDKTVPSQGLGEFFADPAFQKAYDRAARIAAREKQPMPPLSELVDASGNLKRDLTVREFDRIKRGLDDVLDVGKRSPLDAGGLGNEEVASLRRMKNDFLAVADNAVPEYAAARQQFAGESAMLRAFDTGEQFLKLSPDDIAAELAGMSQAEQDAFRKAGIERLAEHIEGITKGNSIPLRLDEKTVMRKRLQALFPDEQSFKQFQAFTAQKAIEHATKRNLLGQSNTVDKLVEYADLAGVDFGAMLQTIQQGKAGLTERFLGAGAKALQRVGTENKANALTPKLLASGKELEKVLADLEAAQRRIAARQAGTLRKSAARSGILGAQAGRAGGSINQP